MAAVPKRDSNALEVQDCNVACHRYITKAEPWHGADLKLTSEAALLCTAPFSLASQAERAVKAERHPPRSPAWICSGPCLLLAYGATQK